MGSAVPAVILPAAIVATVFFALAILLVLIAIYVRVGFLADLNNHLVPEKSR